MPVISLQNFFSWAAQVSILALLGAVLPVVFRIDHPRSHLAYCYALLVTCIVLPLVQPSQHPLVSAVTAQLAQPPREFTNENSAGFDGAAARAVVSRVVAWTLLMGIAARLCWFTIGVWRIRRYRINAAPLQYFPSIIRKACKLTDQSALVCLSSNDIGPVAFGFFRPVVLLPPSFLTLDPDSQCAVLCHELMHVKRRDWIVTVIEELIAAFLWFHPAVWWLLGQTKLAREQVVDAEVIHRTAAPDPYIDALLVLAGAHPDRALLPVPLFLHRRQLIRRLRSLLIRRRVSKLRLTSSYVVILAVLAFACHVAFMSFPMIGEPRIQEPLVDEAAVGRASESERRSRSQEPVFRAGDGLTRPVLLTRVDPEYPEAARKDRIEGSVVVQSVVETDGTMTVTRILRGINPALDDSAVRAITQWRFEPGKLKDLPVPVELDVEVQFRLKP